MVARKAKGSTASGKPSKGLAKATRCALFIDERGTISRQAEEILFRHAKILTEGASERVGGAESFYGSTMITIDLDALAPYLRDIGEVDVQEKLAHSVEGSVRMRVRAMRMACAEVARRVPDRALGTAQVETHVTVVGGCLHLDVDLEVPFDVSSRETRP